MVRSLVYFLGSPLNVPLRIPFFPPGGPHVFRLPRVFRIPSRSLIRPR